MLSNPSPSPRVPPKFIGTVSFEVRVDERPSGVHYKSLLVVAALGFKRWDSRRMLCDKGGAPRQSVINNALSQHCAGMSCDPHHLVCWQHSFLINYWTFCQMVCSIFSAFFFFFYWWHYTAAARLVWLFCSPTPARHSSTRRLLRQVQSNISAYYLKGKLNQKGKLKTENSVEVFWDKEIRLCRKRQKNKHR